MVLKKGGTRVQHIMCYLEISCLFNKTAGERATVMLSILDVKIRTGKILNSFKEKLITKYINNC